MAGERRRKWGGGGDASTEHQRGGWLRGPIGPETLELEGLERVALYHHRARTSVAPAGWRL